MQSVSVVPPAPTHIPCEHVSLFAVSQSESLSHSVCSELIKGQPEYNKNAVSFKLAQHPSFDWTPLLKRYSLTASI